MKLVLALLASLLPAFPQTLAPNGIVNSADYTAALAPGSLITLFGSQLSNVTAIEAAGQPIAPLYVSATQLNARLPLLPPGPLELRLRTPAGLSPPTTITLQPAAPRFFTQSMDGRGDPLLVHGADWSLVNPARPPQPQEILIAFLTGLADVPTERTSVTFGGQPAPVLYAGPAPGFPGLYQLNFQVPANAQLAPLFLTLAAVLPHAPRTVGAHSFASSTRLTVAWSPSPTPVDHYEIHNLTVRAPHLTAELADLQSDTSYTFPIQACNNATCTTQATATARTSPEYWQLHGTGNTVPGLTRLTTDDNARISATRFGPEAGPVTANRIQLYYGPAGFQRQILSTALSNPDSYLSFTSSRATTGLLTPNPPAPLIETVATGQGVPLAAGLGAKVRLFFEAQGTDRRTRIFSLDSVDGYTGQDFNSGPATTCSTAADFSPGGGCALTVEVAVEGDATNANPKVLNARQHKIGYPTQTDWRWDGAPGTFMVFTSGPLAGCTNSNRTHGYAIWDGARWQVQYHPDGCPKHFVNVQAAFPMHLEAARYKLYYGDTANLTGQLPSMLPFLGPKRLLYADGARTGAPDRVDFEDWDRQSQARDVIFLWPNGERLNDTAEGYIDDFHFLTPTNSLDLQVMYLVITDGRLVPTGAAATLLNP